MTVDQDFDAVIGACADRRRRAGWIGTDFRRAYTELARRGIAHSVEARDRSDGRLLGGLYGVVLGGLFAGESMFHVDPDGRDASKVALVELVRMMTADGLDGRLLDVQWCTPHMASLGAVAIPRTDYLERLERALQLPGPVGLGQRPSRTR